MERIHHFFECLLPTSICNLECEYCYLIQEDRRLLENISLDYDPDRIVRALRKERTGGTCYFSLCGTGETFLQKELVEITHGLLKEGHYVNITTNGTISNKIDEILLCDKELLNHLHFSFSLHYIELKKRNILDDFFENVRKVKKNGCSFMVQLNLYDGYEPLLNEIKNKCLKEIGALPQIAATRLETKKNVNKGVKLHTNKTEKEYIELGKSFNSPLFEFTIKNFNKKRREFCYAGAWSSQLVMKTGQLNPCYESKDNQYIFDDLEQPIEYKAVGCCNSGFCINSTHFISLGVIPKYDAPSYVELRDRKKANWFNKEVKSFLSQKLYNNNKRLKWYIKVKIYLSALIKNTYNSFKQRRWNNNGK